MSTPTKFILGLIGGAVFYALYTWNQYAFAVAVGAFITRTFLEVMDS